MAADSIRKKIEGRNHPLVKAVRRMARSGELAADGLVLLETVRMIEDAQANGVRIEQVLVSAAAGNRVGSLLAKLDPATRVYEVSAKVFETLATTESSQGILALAAEPRWEEVDLFPRGRPPLIVVLAGLQDPGNLGTILRAADAIGATGAVLTHGTVSPYNGKAIRATAGALFRVPMLRGVSVAQAVELLRGKRVKIFTSVVAGGVCLPQADLAGPLAVVFGSEGAGAPEKFRAAGEAVTIPMSERAESLNVAAASAVILYEIARQRSLSRER